VLEVADRAFVTAKAHYDFAHQRRQGGVGNRLDEVRAQQEVETTRASAELAHSSLARAQEALGVVLAEDAPVDADPEISLGEAPPVDTAVSDAASRRTDLKVLSSRLSAAEHVLRDSYADYLPSLVAQALPFYNDPSTATSPRTGWQAQLVLSLPLYDGGLRYGAHDERRALASEAQVALDAALRQVQSDVRATYESLTRADAALEASRNAARLAAEALDLASQAYHAGATTNLEVIDAERRARDADTTAAVAEDTARQARLDLLAASGRFP
jgi:outer membrane protein TolC